MIRLIIAPFTLPKEGEPVPLEHHQFSYEAQDDGSDWSVALDLADHFQISEYNGNKGWGVWKRADDGSYQQVYTTTTEEYSDETETV
jgi:hypothetical protein